MIELAFEILGAINLGVATGYWLMDHDDIMHWLFFLLVSAIMYINAIRYEKDDG